MLDEEGLDQDGRKAVDAMAAQQAPSWALTQQVSTLAATGKLKREIDVASKKVATVEAKLDAAVARI